VYVSERRYGSFLRTIALPDDIDVERADVSEEDGVLTIRFPKVESRTERRRIPVAT
jgi:HSP20 family protein